VSDERPSDAPPRLQQIQRLLELHGRVQAVVLQLRAESEALAAPVDSDGEGDDRPVGLAALTRLITTLNEVLTTARRSEAHLQSEIEYQAGSDEDTELPPGLARFISERSQNPNFEYWTELDPIRGCVLHWRERTGGGWVRGRGILHERPHDWLHE